MRENAEQNNSEYDYGHFLRRRGQRISEKYCCNHGKKDINRFEEEED